MKMSPWRCATARIRSAYRPASNKTFSVPKSFSSWLPRNLINSSPRSFGLENSNTSVAIAGGIQLVKAEGKMNFSLYILVSDLRRVETGKTRLTFLVFGHFYFEYSRDNGKMPSFVCVTIICSNGPCA